MKTLDLVLFVLASPILLVKALFRGARWIEFYRVSYLSEIMCRSCQETISLVGIWRCVCGYTYRGHVLRPCPVCQSLPRMVRCFACGVTARFPKP